MSGEHEAIGEKRRLAALQSYDILDTPSEAAFDDIAKLASQICGVPIALVSLIDEHRQWFKAKVGLDLAETPRNIAFCDHAIRDEGLFEIEDALSDTRFSQNPLVLGGPQIRFYAGVPLQTPEGENLGTLCVIDQQPRTLSQEQRAALAALARMVITQLELRRTVAQARTDAIALRESDARYRVLSEHLEIEVAARSQELARVWNNSHDVMLVIGLDGLVRSLNPATTAMLGWSAEDMVGNPIIEFIHPDDRPPPVGGGGLDPGRYREGGVFKNRFRMKNGGERWIAWGVSKDEEVVYYYGRDVTEETLQAEALAASEQRLRQSQKMEAVGQLTGGLAHDFNNLLTGIAGSLELLDIRVQQGRFDELVRYTAAARGAAKRAAALTHRLLAFSRQQTLDPKSVDVNRLIGEMEELIRRSVGPMAQIEVVGAGGLWPTRVDPNQLENALLNLCINARDAMPYGGKITIETANKWFDDRGAQERDVPPGQYVSLCVTDTGTGMTKEVIERAFDPFFTTKPIGQGTGLGLSMIYGFARQSGGQVRIYSELGQGTTMCIYLPRDHQAPGAEPVSKPGESVDLRGSGETVLIVDDEPTVRMLVTEVLHEFGYQSIEAGDGSAGLKVLQSDARVDLLITDVGLPGGMNGRQVADAARVFRPDLKVLFITGYAENAAVGNGQLDPGMQILTKPFSMEDLAKKIRAMV